MKYYCKRCGAELPDNALFCTKCGVEDPIERSYEQDSNAPAVGDDNAQKPSGARKEIDIIGMVKEHFMPIFVILGVVAFVLLHFSALFVLSAFGLGVTVGVFAIIAAILFCLVGGVKFFMGEGGKDGKKHSASEIICFAIGIIGFIYVLVTCIVVLKYGSDILDIVETFKMLGEMGDMIGG